MGFFGVPNIGDELLCTVETRWLLRHGFTRVWVHTRSAKVSRNYSELPGPFAEGFFPGPEHLSNLGKHIRSVRDSRFVWVGGGGLLGDRYSWASVPRYAFPCVLAILLNRPYSLVGIGALPIRRWWLRPLAKLICRDARVAICRDLTSAERVGQLGERTDIRVAPDLGHLVSDLPMFQGRALPGDYAVVNLRSDPAVPLAQVQVLCEEIGKVVGTVVLLSAEAADSLYYRQVVSTLPKQLRARIRVEEPPSLSAAVELVAQAKYVAAVRLHVNLLALHAGRPLLSILYEGKVRRLHETMGDRALCCELDGVSRPLVRALLTRKSLPCSADLQRQGKRADVSLRAAILGRSLQRYSTWSRVSAVFWLAAMLFTEIVYAALVSLKRDFFGRR